MHRSLPRLLLALPLLAAVSCRTTAPAPGAPAAPVAVGPVAPVARFADAKLGMEIVQGELRLPARYLHPALRPAAGEAGVAQVYLSAPKELSPDRRALRRARAEDEGGAAADATPAASGPDDVVTWKVLALRRGAAADAALELEPERGAPTQRIAWAVGRSAEGGRELLKEWATARLAAQDAWGRGDGPLQGPLVIAAAGAYGLGDALVERWERLGAGDDADGNPSLLALLGGRAAVDETLQLDRALAAPLASEEPSVPVDEVEGIGVEPHPWKEMLAGREAPRLPLADCVPPDRALLYLPQPQEAIDGLEHGGAGFLQRVSSFAREGRLDYAIIERYLEDLGLGGGLGRRLLKAGAVKAAAIYTPDLSLLSGTDVTVVAEISPLFLPLLPIPEGEVREKETPGGRAFKARRGARVFLSTSRAELDLALALDAAGGAGSLGRSDELAVLLLKLSPTERTQAFAYLSDPFIRRLLGPAQRIAQARLDHARTEMELLAGAALLRRQDVPGEAPTIDGLLRLGYLPPGFPAQAYTLRPDGRVASPVFGPLERLHPASRLGLTRVTEEEAERYERFREGYTRYWRRFFDPIAVRLDAKADGGRELETFILPLLDSSIYRELGRELAKEARPSMAAPRWTFPAPVELSVQLPDKMIEESAGRTAPSDLRRLGLSVPDDLFASVAPTAHIAFPDSAPILQVGGGAAYGVVSAGTERAGEAWISVMLAALTRPMVVAVELKDPERARRALDRVVSPPAAPRERRSRDWVRVRAARDAADRLIVTSDFFGLVTIRQAVRVEGRWLVVTNDTTLPEKLIAGEHELRGAAASVALRPAALKLGLPSAWQAASEAEGDAAWAAQHWLAPWLADGAGVAEAQGASRALLGAAPVLEADALRPGPNQTQENRRFGTRWRPRIPAMETKEDFGLFEGVSEARVEMSFEADGLRTRVTWRGAAGR